jgi:hypothetical protein
MHKRRPRSISALTIILRKLTVTRGRIHTRVPPGPEGKTRGERRRIGSEGWRTKGKNAQGRSIPRGVSASALRAPRENAAIRDDQPCRAIYSRDRRIAREKVGTSRESRKSHYLQLRVDHSTLSPLSSLAFVAINESRHPPFPGFVAASGYRGRTGERKKAPTEGGGFGYPLVAS